MPGPRYRTCRHPLGIRHLLNNDSLEELIEADFVWQNGWEYELDETCGLADLLSERGN
jgi:hypothetical protein